MEKTFQQLIQENRFIITWELVPGRGAWEDSNEKVLQQAQQAAKGKKIHAVSLTDNPGGSTAILPGVLGKEIAGLGMETVIHITTKDKNRSQLESQIYALERLKLYNLLVVSGDYASESIYGSPKPVFDLDSTQLLQLIANFNKGVNVPTPRGKIGMKPTHFFAGAAVSPFKATEAEQMLQYSKLKKKIENGAQFIITQVGYDARKFQELLLYAQMMGWKIPFIGNIFLLNYPGAKLMNQNKIPGCVVTDKMLTELEQERNNPDKGVGAKLERAAKQYAILKGMGYQGVHIGGLQVKYEHVEYVIARGEELLANWQEYAREFAYPQDHGFYVFEKDDKNGLNLEKMAEVPATTETDSNFTYKVSRIFHKLFFIPGKNFFPAFQRFADSIQGHKPAAYFHTAEHLAKAFLYNCQDCGDCALIDTAYVCPMGECPKNQRNGPCEGSYYGWCEVYPGKKKCIWVRAYQHLKKYAEQEQLNSYQISPYNWKLQHTSSWLNFYLGKDHSAERLGIRCPKEKKKSQEDPEEKNKM
jgi:methylenetetrahydrofolate reductase (NADPH)